VRRIDVAIIGGGPAGLATAIGAASRGLSVEVFERRPGPLDKACGEGLMPAGLAALERLGVRALLREEDTAPFESILYVQQGARVEGRLPSPGGLGVRRLALVDALTKRAREVGVKLNDSTGVRGHLRVNGGVEITTDHEPLVAGVLVGADGLHSPTRSREGLAGPVALSRRFGLRRHFALTPWNRAVEVHFADGVEAYVTPAGRSRVGLAFLWEDGRMRDASFDTLLAHFPELQRRLSGAAFDSAPRGAGPLLQRVTRRVAERVALVGDAAGYVDAITGEGLTQAFEGAEALSRVLPEALRRNGAVDAFAPYERHAEAAFSRYARLAHSLVWTARRPALRRTVVSTLARAPWLFERALAATT
jgi:flavin-dependent dehydrogenase